VTFIARSIRESLDQADELAQRFENYEPDAADERPVEEYMLERAALARARSERQVADARDRSTSIGRLLAEERKPPRHVSPSSPDTAPSSTRVDPPSAGLKTQRLGALPGPDRVRVVAYQTMA
jgi:hypothetical protein